MSGAVITGVGWVTSEGGGQGRLNATFAMADAPLPALTREAVGLEHHPRYGRQPEYSRVGTGAIALALRDAGCAKWDAKRPMGIVAASRLGCLATDVEYYEAVLPTGDGIPRPSLFAFTLPNCFIGEAAIYFGLTGPTVVANDGGGDSLCAWRLALESLMWGEATTMLAGQLDVLVGAALPGLPPVTPGAIFMVLEAGRSASASDYGTLNLIDGIVHHNGHAMHDAVALVRACLATRVA
jgi:3-oxoacyl-[acyl-carrier-protein] synthase II